ncbi:MAG: ankyrin repeat domain-containing protein [Wolbachia endosymbiont of Hylaeus sinuatus]|nr:ankyrin repeat domain-containing protein [Wolbachia endosymbiont of Hylaeus sinuatus]
MTTNTENNNRINIVREQAGNAVHSDIAYSERIQKSVENEALCDAWSNFEYFEDVLRIKNSTDRENRIKQLIKEDLDINATKNGKTILDVAIEKKCSSKVISSLISNGSRIDTIDASDRTVLHRSVRNENRKVVELFLEANEKEVSQYLVARFLPLSMLYQKIEVNAKDNDGCTALDYAQYGSEMYSLLQKYGAQHSEKFLYSRNLNIGEGANINVNKGDQALLSVAAEKGDVENAVLLLERGAHEGVNSQDAEGRTLLLNAIIQDKLGHAKYLIKQRVNVNIPDNNGNSSLHYAVVNFIKQRLIECDETYTANATFYDFLKNGADLYIKNHDNLTAFEYAFHARIAPREAVYLFKLYIERGDQSENMQLVKNFKLPSGETLLEYFFNNKLFDSAQSCIDLGANVSHNGSSLLIQALQNRDIEGIGFLLRNRADIPNNANISNNKKNCKLYFQVAVGCVAMFSLGMGAAATFTLIKMSPLVLVIVAVTFFLTAIASMSLFVLYKKVKGERKHEVIVNNAVFNISLEEAANDLFSGLSTIAERGAEAGALYLEVKEKTESVAKKMTSKKELIEARFQNIQENFINKLSNFEELQGARDSSTLKKFYAAVKDVLKIRSSIPISNLHLLSLVYHLSLEVSYAIFQAITDPTLGSTILTAISERKLPEDKQWAKVLKNTVPNLIRNQEVVRNVIVPTLTDILKSLSESREERKFIIYTLVCLKEVIDEVYTTSVQESLYRILGVELANSLNGMVQAISNLLGCYGHEEVERARTANELDYRVGKLTPEETQQFVINLGERVGSLREFEGRVTNKQSISKLIDYCLDPKLNDREAAATLLNYILTCTENGRYLAAEAGTNNNLSSNSNVVLITHVAANRSAQLD